MFLAAASQRTQRIRLGHGIVLMPPGYNQPARVAERIATLDLVSRGRVDWGTGESASRAELEGYGVNPAERRAMWRETVEQVANMMVMEPYPGFKGQYFSMPARNVVPKPVQKPHPPIWVACSNRETIHLAAQLGIGALTFAFIDPAEAKQWVDDYYETFKRECVPIGHAVNPNIAMVTGFSCHRDAAEAQRRGADGFRFFQFALAHHYVFGKHTPGRTNIWNAFLKVREQLGTEVLGGGVGCIGTPGRSARHAARCSRRPASTRPSSSSRAARTGTSTSASRWSCSRPRSCRSSTSARPSASDASGRSSPRTSRRPWRASRRMRPLADDEIPVHEAYGNTVALTDEDHAEDAGGQPPPRR